MVVLTGLLVAALALFGAVIAVAAALLSLPTTVACSGDVLLLTRFSETIDCGPPDNLPLEVRRAVWAIRLKSGFGLLGLVAGSDQPAAVTVAGVRLSARPRARRDRVTAPEDGAASMTILERLSGLADSSSRLLAWLAEPVRRRGGQALRALRRAVRVSAGGEVQFGFPDPALTGLTLAAIATLTSGRGLRGVRVEPRFDAELLAASGTLQASFTPLRVALIICRFLLAREVRQLWRNRRRASRVRSSERLQGGMSHG